MYNKYGDSMNVNLLKNEENMSMYATKSSDGVRLKEFKEDIRPNYFRDIDKIIYSHCYSRYIDKTQVFSFKNNDHITKRIIHVQLVSKIARTIGRALNLNEDLIEAISLGHDVGHVPFGHVGESILNEISLKYLDEPFKHNVQSVRNLMVLENNGKGINLCVQVLDGILCHNGEKLQKIYNYKHKTTEEFIKEYNKCYTKEKFDLVPMTLEGCVVRLSDVIGYLGRDIEDAITLGIIDKEDIPINIRKKLGENNSSIISLIINDVIINSINKPYIKLSDEYYNLMNELLDFNYKNIYAKAYTNDEKNKIKEMFNDIYKSYLIDLETNNINSSICKVFLNEMNEEYKNNTSNERIVIDYISGMTDDFFVNEYNKLSSWLNI
mgnify:FL=1